MEHAATKRIAHGSNGSNELGVVLERIGSLSGGQQQVPETQTLDDELAAEVAVLGVGQTAVLISLLADLRTEGIPLVSETVKGMLGGARQVVEWEAERAAEQAAANQRRRYRDNLDEPQRIRFVVREITRHVCFPAAFQRLLIKELLGEPVTADDAGDIGAQLDYAVSRVRLQLEGTTPEFQQKVFSHYAEHVLPRLEQDEAAERELTSALNDLLDFLHGKSPQEIRALIV